MEIVIAYTDGSCNPKNRRGGWGAVIVNNDDASVEMHGYDDDTTNNIMEMTAVISVIEKYKDCNKFKIHTDSTYVIGCATGKYKIKLNKELWEKYKKITKEKEIEFVKVLAHSGDEHNERADYLANKWRSM